MDRKKVALFWFENHYYVIPYKWNVSQSIDLISKANGYVFSKNIDEELRIANSELINYGTIGNSKITSADIIKSLKECWIISHDMSQLIGSTDSRLNLPTISDEIIKEYNAKR